MDHDPGSGVRGGDGVLRKVEGLNDERKQVLGEQTLRLRA